MQGVNIGIYISLVLVLVYGIFRGFRKGLYKSIVDFFVIAITAVLSVIATKAIAKEFINAETLSEAIDYVSASFPDLQETLTMVKELIVDLASDGNVVSMVMSLPTVILTPLIFFIVFSVIGLILEIPKLIICRCVFGKNGGETYHGGSRIGGAVVGVLARVLSFVILMIPIVGYANVVGDVTQSLAETGGAYVEEANPAESMSDVNDEEQADEEEPEQQTQTLAQTVDSISTMCSQVNNEYIEPLRSNIVFKAIDVCGGRWIFNSLSSVKIDDTKVSLSKEVDVLCRVYIEATELLTVPVAEFDTAQTEAVTNITNILDEATVAPSVVSGVLSYTAETWLNGEEVFGYPKVNVGEYYEPTLDKVLVMLSETTNETVSQDIHTLGNIVNICIEQGMFAEAFGGGTPMNVVQKEEFVGEILVELYKNDTARPLVQDVVNAFKNYIYRIYNDVNETNVPYPEQLVIDNMTEEDIYNEGALLASILDDFKKFYDSYDQNETDNTEILINTDLRSLGRALDGLKKSEFIGDSYSFIIRAVLKSEGASQFAFLTPEFIEVMINTNSSMETVLVARQQIAIIASVVEPEGRAEAIEHLLQNVDSDSAEVIMETLTPEILQSFGMTSDKSDAMSSTLGSLLTGIADSDKDYTAEELQSEVQAVDKIITTIQAVTDDNTDASLFSTPEAEQSKTGMTAGELVETVVNSDVVSSAIISASKDEEGNVVENPYKISDKIGEADKENAKTAIESYYNDNASADADNEELKQKLNSLANVLGVEVALGE